MINYKKYTYKLFSTQGTEYDKPCPALTLLKVGDLYFITFDHSISSQFIQDANGSIKLKLFGLDVEHDRQGLDTDFDLKKGTWLAPTIGSIVFEKTGCRPPLVLKDGTLEITCQHLDYPILANQKIIFQMIDTSESDGREFTVNVTINFKRLYNKEKLEMYYRIGTEMYTKEFIECTNVIGYPYFQALTDQNFTIILKQEHWDKSFEYYVDRPALKIPYTNSLDVLVEDSVTFPSQRLIENTIITLPRHMQRFNKCVEVGEQTLLFSFRVVYDKECAASHYYVNKVDFLNNTAYQVVDIVITDGDESVVNSSTDDVPNAIRTVGNVLFHQENIMTDTDGYFIQLDGQRIKYPLPMLSDNQNYRVYTLLHSIGEIHETIGTTNTNLIIGANDVVNRIHWPGELIMVNSQRPIKTAADPADDGLEWFFDLGTTLKSSATNPNSSGYAHGDMGVVICEDGERKPDSTWYDMMQKSSLSNPVEVYNCMQFYDRKSIVLGNFYYKESYEDKGLGGNIFPNDILGNVPYCKYSYLDGNVRRDSQGNPVDRYGNRLIPEEGKYRYNTFFMKFYAECDEFNLLEIKSGNNTFRVSADITAGTVKFICNTEGGTKVTTCNVPLARLNWYTLFLIFNDGVLKGVSICKLTSQIFFKVFSSGDQIDLNGLNNTSINKDNFLDYSESDYIAIPSLSQHDDLFVCKVGLILKDLDTNISSQSSITISDYVNPTIVKMLQLGYTMVPSVTLTHKLNAISPLVFTNFIESKSNQVSFYLPLNEYAANGDTLIKENLPKGQYTLSLDCDGINYALLDIQVKSIKPDDTTIGFECDFENNYSQAVSTFIDRFYIRQEKRAGDLSGGENGNNVYFNRGEKCLVLENHGDFYGEEEDQLLPCNQKAPVTEYYIGAPAEILKYDLNDDNSVCYYDANHKPDPYKTRVTRVGSLVQTKDYYGYGEWKMRMRIPKDFTGAAICWWVFHYQEHYPNNDNRYFDFYSGGLDRGNRTVVLSMLGGPDADGRHSYEKSYLPFNYRHDFSVDSGKPYIKVNNEIDMEMGSEMCSVYGIQPPTVSGIQFHVSAIDAKTVYFCTSEANYGMWVVDYESTRTQNNLKAKFNALKAEYEETGTIDRYNSPNIVIEANLLDWIKVSENPDIEEKRNLGAWQQFDAHKTWGIRWNNWFSEGDNSTGTLGKSKFLNIIDVFYNTEDPEEFNGWDSLNVGASMTLRTPLGDWDIHNEDVSKRFIPHRYDDDQYHDYRFEYRRDYTAIYIDNELVKINRMNVPFIPMAALIGVWFPTFNSWDIRNVWEGHFGGWGGLDAKWDVRHAKVSYISYRPYSAEEEPRDKMIYHPESFPADGLRKIEGIYIEDEKVTLTITTVPLNADVYMNGTKTTSLQVQRGSTIVVKASAPGYKDFEQSYVVYSDTTKQVILILETPSGPTTITTMEQDYARITSRLDTLIEENGADNLVMWSLVTDQHATINDPAKYNTYQAEMEAEIIKWMTQLRQLGEAYNFSVFLNGGDITGYLGEFGDVINGEVLPAPLNADGTIPGNEGYTSEELTQMNQATLDAYYSPEYNACTNVFKDNPIIPMMFAPGNHDRLGSAGKYRCYVPLSLTKQNTVTPFENVHPIFIGTVDEDSNYTYYDDETKKVRFIVFDSYYERWKANWLDVEIEGLDNKALKKCFNKPNDWKYVILLHDGYTTESNIGHCIPDTNSKYTDCEHDVDFSGVDTTNLLVCLNGHGHVSNQALIPTLDNKVFEIITQASSAANSIFSSRTKSWDVMPDVPYISIGTVAGHAIDIFVYNKTTEDLYVFRWGAGADRYFNLNQNNPTFKYVTFKASFSSNDITDFNGYKLLLSSRLDGLYYRNRKDNYKTNIFLNLDTEGNVDSNNKVEDDASYIIGIPYLTDLRAYLIDSSENVVWTSEIFTTSEWSYDWNINLDT